MERFKMASFQSSPTNTPSPANQYPRTRSSFVSVIQQKLQGSTTPSSKQVSRIRQVGLTALITEMHIQHSHVLVLKGENLLFLFVYLLFKSNTKKNIERNNFFVILKYWIIDYACDKCLKSDIFSLVRSGSMNWVRCRFSPSLRTPGWNGAAQIPL